MFGTNVPAKLPKARSVQVVGKSVTESSPITTNARPRNSASVPIVTAREGSPRRVTSRPLNAPQSAPTRRQTGMITSTGWPLSHIHAITALDRASTEATDRSISAATITIVSGSAINAISERSSEPVVKERGQESEEMDWPAKQHDHRATSSAPSARRARGRPVGARRRVPRASRGRSGPSGGRRVAASAGTSSAPCRRAASMRSPIAGRGRSRAAAARRPRPAARRPGP